MSTDCLFCRIVHRELDADIVFENEDVVAFRDLRPQAPVHILVVPRNHIASAGDFRESHRHTVASLFLAAAKIAVDQGVDGDGYRLVLNVGEGAGQSVFHVHVHLLGGRPMTWPPG